MLVLSRRIGESVVISDEITVTVIEVQRGKIRLGITAPASVRVDRKEVHDRRQDFLVEPELEVVLE